MKKASPGADRLRPWLLGGATALFVCRPLFTAEGAISDGDGLPVAMLWIVLAVVWMLYAVGKPHFTLRFSWTEAAVTLLLALVAISALWAVHAKSPRPAVNALFEWLALGLGFFLLRQFIAGEREGRAVVAVMVALAAAVACYGLYQVLFELPATRAYYFADPEGALRDLGIPAQPGPLRELFESRLRNSEPLATFALTNSLAAFLSPWLVTALGIGIFAWSRGRLDRSTAVAVACAALPLAVCLLWTKSRSGYVAVVVGILATGLACRGTSRIGCHAHPKRSGGWAGPRKRGHGTPEWNWRCYPWSGSRGWKVPAAVAAAIVAVTTAAVVVAASCGDRGQSSGGYTSTVIGRASRSFGFRLQYWRSTLRVIGDHWLVGCGPGNFQNAYTRYKLPEASEEVADPHNFLLEIWSTAGTPAMLAFLGVLGSFAAAMRHRVPDRVGMAGAAAGSPNRVPCTAGQAGSGTQRVPESVPSTAGQASSGTLPPAACRLPLAPADRPFFVLGGAALGLVLSIPLGLMSTGPPSPAMILIVSPIMAGVTLLWWRWIRQGRLPPLLPAIAIAALLVDLSAAGGIGVASVAGSFWLLSAVGLSAVDVAPARRLPRSFALVGLIVALLLTLACYAFAYAPVLACQAAMRTAYRHPLRAETLLRAAAIDDPWAAKPRELLAALALEAWRTEPDDGRQRQFERYNAMRLEVDSASSAAWLASGDGYFEIAMKTHRPYDLLNAIDSYQHAVELYPNSGPYRAKLALALRAAGRTAEFRQEADMAQELDRLTPHESMKLPPEIRKQLGEGAGAP